MVTTAQIDSYSLSEWSDSVTGSVRSDAALPHDAAGTKLLADKIEDVATEKPTEVGPTSKMAASISCVGGDSDNLVRRVSRHPFAPDRRYNELVLHRINPPRRFLERPDASPFLRSRSLCPVHQ
jgi:hypothetical protein